MTPVYASGAFAVAFWVTVAAWTVLERFLSFRDLFGWLRDRRRGIRTARSLDGGTVLLAAAGIGGGLLAGLGFASVHALDLPIRPVWIGIGLGVAWAGIVVRLWAVVTLGRFFTTTVVLQSDHRVVSSGPYRVVRHPSYLGLLLIMFGLGVALSNIASLAVMILLPAGGLLPRIRVEEATLHSGLGDSYGAYCNGRPRLIPGVW